MPNSKITEKQLDIAFAETLIGNEGFRDWVLSGSKFGHLRPNLRLLSEDLSRSRRTPARSWRHVWCVMPDGSEGETDIFAVFEADGGYRFALHFENKPPHGILRPNQDEDYPKRAAFLAGHPRYLRYQEWETAIIAPRAFIDRHADRCRPFDRALTYEAVAEWIPLLGDALASARIALARDHQSGDVDWLFRLGGLSSVASSASQMYPDQKGRHRL